MKRFHCVLIGAVLLAMATVAMASPVSLTSFPLRVMPVLVHVNSLGKVTEVQPSAQLPPRLQRLLASSLRQWISKPAIVGGHPVDSQSIVNVALHATPRKDGRYAASFAFVSIVPAPFASAYWSTRNGTQLALVESHGGSAFVDYGDDGFSRGAPVPTNYSPQPMASSPRSFSPAPSAQGRFDAAPAGATAHGH
ncbi:MAG: hypothetical protein KGJ97_11845 [Xanthomonadaceae bacterium]|nr:hypothetical protein [Xanthomonadaceae bacterium]MDE3073476.1 hypothetical protein [Pseudomonadota bacterium]